MSVMRIALAAALAATASVSAAGALDGPFLQAGIGFADSHTRVRTNWTDTNIDAHLGQTSFIGQMAIGYNRSFGAFSLGVGAFYNVGDQNAGTIDVAGQYGANPYSFRNTNTWGISVDPGMNFGESTLAYLKFGFAQTSGRGTELFRGDTYRYDGNYRGLLLGVGAKYRLTPNLYGVAELQQVGFGTRRWGFVDGDISLKPAELTGVLGIGYRF